MSTTESCAAQVRPGLEHPSCPLCHDQQREFPFELSHGHRLARCKGCGLHYLYPRLTEEAMQLVYQDPAYFQGGESGYSDTSYFEQESALRATFKALLRNLQKRGMTGGDLLEVGCGYGYLLDEARTYFRRRVGTEFSPEAAARPRNRCRSFRQRYRSCRRVQDDCALAIRSSNTFNPVRFMNQACRPRQTGAVVSSRHAGHRRICERSWAGLAII